MDDLIEGMIRLMDQAHTGETIVLAKVGQPMSASDALEAVSSTAHPRPVECSWPLAASRSPVRAALSRGTGELGSKLLAPGSIAAITANMAYLLDSYVLPWW